MRTIDQVKDDMGYVAATVRRAEGDGVVAAICFLWALLIPIGFALADFKPETAGLYWLFAGPLGGLASFWLGWRAGRRRGEIDRKTGLAHAWHWIFAMLGFVGVMFPVMAGSLAPSQAAPYFLLVCALAHGLAAPIDPSLRWAGLIMYAGFAALTLVELPHTWSLTGILVGGSLLYSGLRARR